MSAALWDITCPKCAAQPREACRTLTTNRSTDTHKARTDAWWERHGWSAPAPPSPGDTE